MTMISSELNMLTAAEAERMLIEWNRTEETFPGDCIHQLFEKNAAQTPDRTALVFGQRRLNYRELDERANQLAHYLQERGVGRNSIVGICVERSPELIVSVLAVLKAGGTYIPYDPAYPVDRLARMFETAEQTALVTSERLLERLPRTDVETVCVDRDAAAVARRDRANPPEFADAASMCYAIFTSGSTGLPKLAGVYHRGWSNLLNWFIREFDIGPADRTLIMSSFSFDITQRSIAMPLISGGELHLVESDGYEPDLIVKTIARNAITRMNCAPSTFYPLIERDPADWPQMASLRTVFLGGEAISASRLADWAVSGAGSTELANVYGAAECSDVSSFYRLRDFERYAKSSVPVGRPISNTKVYVLDEQGAPQPEGALGEICIAGIGVGHGYLNDPELTARKFIADPFSSRPGALLYRTGDLGCHMPDGNLAFKGRVDHQVKIRGQRVELGDVEAALRQLPSIKEAVVVDWEKSAGDRRLTAYVVAAGRAGAADESTDDWRDGLAAILPAYMIPNEFIVLGSLPLSPNGKIDRTALPAPGGANLPAAPAAPGGSPTEQALTKIFSEVLEVESVGPDVSFFTLGGHSLLATRVIARIAETFNVQLPRIEFYASPTVAGVADKIERRLAAQAAE